MLADTDKEKLNTDRDYLISKLYEELGEIDSTSMRITAHLLKYCDEATDGSYTDSALRCRFCEMDILREMLEIFERSFDMSDVEGED